MKRMLSSVCASACLLLLGSGCGATYGVIYQDVAQPPIDIMGSDPGFDWDAKLNATSGPRKVVKSGEACSSDVLKLVAWGDGSQVAAAKAGGITRIHGVDFDVTSVLLIGYTRACTTVYGE